MSAAALSSVSVVLVPYDQDEPLEELRLPKDSLKHAVQQRLRSETPENVVPTLLLRPTEATAGLYAYQEPSQTPCPNIRATRLSMACGLFSVRCYGKVILTRASPSFYTSLSIREVLAARSLRPDLRPQVLFEVSEVLMSK